MGIGRFALDTFTSFVYSPGSKSQFEHPVPQTLRIRTNMNLSFLQPFQYLYQLFTKDDSPKQLAFGVALGMAIGIIPKGNLIAASLMVMLLAFRTNLGAGLLTIAGVSSLTTRLDPLLHGIGERILGNATIYNRMSLWYELPLIPWTSLNNTVVMGGVVLGAALFYPAYHISEMLFERYYDVVKSNIVRRLSRKRVTASSVDIDSNTPIPEPHVGRSRTDLSSPLRNEIHTAGHPLASDDMPSEVIVDWRRG